MLDLAKQRGNDVQVGLIEESILVNPEMGLFPMRTITGTAYKTVVRTGYPVAQFRNLNEGVPRSKSSFENRTVECYIIDSAVAADKAVADAWEPGGAAAYQMVESQGVMEAVMRLIAKQIYYGNSDVAIAAGLGAAKGFPGLVDAYDTTNHQVDATGSTALTSVWAVKLGIKDIHLIGGANNSLNLAMPEWRIQTIGVTENTQMTAYVNSLMGWIGMQFGSVNSAVRIKNIGTDTNKGMTDALGQAALELFPSGVAPDYFIMNRRSRRQLKNSRTSVSLGQGWNQNSVAMPTEIEGIPLIITDALSNAETF